MIRIYWRSLSSKAHWKAFEDEQLSSSNLTSYLTAQVTEELLPLSGVSHEWKVAYSKGGICARETPSICGEGKELLKQLGYPDRWKTFLISYFPACSLLRSIYLTRFVHTELLLSCASFRYITSILSHDKETWTELNNPKSCSDKALTECWCSHVAVWCRGFIQYWIVSNRSKRSSFRRSRAY